MNIQDVEKQLNNYKDADYLPYLKHVIVSDKQMYGVRSKHLRYIAKQVLSEDAIEIIDDFPSDIYEYEILYALIVGNYNKDHHKKLLLIQKCVLQATNWCTIDTLCSCMRKNFANSDYQLAIEYINKNEEYEQRFGYVLLLNCFSKTHSTQILEDIKHTSTPYYYSMMAKAWCIAECAIYAKDSALLFLKNEKDIALKSKAISKICDSKRFSEEIKDQFRSLRAGM